MCTRVFWNRNGVAQVCGRTMDWETSDLPRLWVIPRGTERHGATDHGALTWTSRYGTASMQGWGVATTEAVNEAGLSARVLYLGATEWEPADERPVIANLLWTQYAADNYATVAEALIGLSDVRVESVPIHGAHLGGHLLLEDASGDSALIEIVGGTPTIHHGPQYDVVANDPPYDEQVAGLERYRPWGGQLGIPGDIVSEERFVRATYYLSHLPTPADAAQAVAGVFGIVRNCQVPYGAPDSRFGTYPTWWASVTDLTNRVYYFQSTLAPNVVWLELDTLSLEAGDAVRSLDPRDPHLAGAIDQQLVPTELDWGVG
jgi:penicillin V acylase-like amidase (Ntn superfamily)